MKKALITGANRSIGFEITRQLATQGYFIYLGSRDKAKGEQAADELKAEGLTNIEVVEIDTSDAASIAAARDYIAQKTGVLDVLINNAGISGGFPQPASSLDVAIIREVFNTNVFGVILTTQAFLELLKASAEPRIVNVTSGLASLTLHSDPSWKYYEVKSAAYGPSKSALNAYTIALAHELRDTAFKVNAVDPGYTATEFNHYNGPGTVPDAAARIVKYATIGNDGPTGGFFSDDNNPETGVSPW
jgi:NAD(P)-dependent dehydrogenase (short-subunit alcohol dehydrogenase family)